MQRRDFITLLGGTVVGVLSQKSDLHCFVVNNSGEREEIALGGRFDEASPI
jgi:hypothetical protein